SVAISKLPDSIFDMSRMPLTTDSRCWPESLMSCAYSLRRAASSINASSCTIISEKPMMAFSGVRNSWLTVARKRVLAASAGAAGKFKRLFLHFAIGDVAHPGDHLGFGFPAPRSPLDRPAAHLEPDEVDLTVHAGGVRPIPAQAKLDAARFTVPRHVGQRREI